MSDKITITIDSEELEKINIELTTEEVLALYKLRKEQSARIEVLEKESKDNKSSYDTWYKAHQELQKKVDEAHKLLSALGVPEKTDDENSYSRKELSIAVRIGIYLAKIK